MREHEKELEGSPDTGLPDGDEVLRQTRNAIGNIRRNLPGVLGLPSVEDVEESQGEAKAPLSSKNA